MILIFSLRAHWLSHIYFLLKHYEFSNDIIILSDYNEKYFREADVIIPIGIKSQKALNEYPKYRNKSLQSPDYIYDMFNDKIAFYRMVEKYAILKDSDIKLIKTYDKTYRGPNQRGKFILKHREGAGSNNKILTDNIYNLINEYGDDYQIQDLLDVKQVNGINCVCKDGDIIGGFNFIFKGFIDKNNNTENVKQTLKYIEPQFKDIILKITKKYKYNGLIEFEFLETTDNDIYLMEVNPRMSGNIKCTVISDIPENDDKKYAPYITNLIIPYCNAITNLSKKFTLPNYDDNCELIYHGDIKKPKYEIDENNVVRIIEKILIPYDEYYFDKVMALSTNDNFIGNKLNNINNVIKVCENNDIQIIFPYACEHIQFLINNSDQLKKHNIKYCIPPKDIFECFNDKIKFYNYMMENGFSESIPKIYEKITYPCILKHNKSYYGRNTHIIKSEEDMKKIPPDVKLEDYSICEIIEGKKEYATHIFALDGIIEIELTIVHHFDRSVFVHGVAKKPIMSSKIKINDNVLKIFKEIIKKSSYNGIMCIDYKIIDNIPKIFEINPRMGGSLINTGNPHGFMKKYIKVCS